MTDKKPEILDDAALDAAHGGYELKNVLVTSYSIGGAGDSAAPGSRTMIKSWSTSGNADEVPMEDFSLNFEEIKVT